MGFDEDKELRNMCLDECSGATDFPTMTTCMMSRCDENRDGRNCAEETVLMWARLANVFLHEDGIFHRNEADPLRLSALSALLHTGYEWNLQETQLWGHLYDLAAGQVIPTWEPRQQQDGTM